MWRAILLVATLSLFGCSAQSVDDASEPENMLEMEPKIQIGPWFPIAWNAEMPFINVLHATETYLCEERSCREGARTDTYYAQEAVDPVTLLPKRIIGERVFLYPVFSSGTDTSGEWVLEWEGDADVAIVGERGPGTGNRIEFTKYDDPHDPDDQIDQVVITRIGAAGLKSLALYRKEHEAAYKSGKVYTDQFVNYYGRYHIIRTMDLQYAYRAFISSVDELAARETLNWGNMWWNRMPYAGCKGCASWDHPKRSLPLPALFALGMETDTELWVHAPLMLGAKRFIGEVEAEDIADDKDAIWASPEWARYYDAFVAELIASGYPADRTLFMTTGNEVWNTAGGFNGATQYAVGIGMAFRGKGQHRAFREGYGALLAKHVTEMEAALSRAGRQQEVVYVLESQAAVAETTKVALRYYKDEIKRLGGDWSSFADKTIVSIASYWGVAGWGHAFPDVEASDFQAVRDAFEQSLEGEMDFVLDAVETAMVSAPAYTTGSLNRVIQNAEAHDREARRHGVRLGAFYEGGSHDSLPYPFRRRFGEDNDRVKELYDRFVRERGGSVNDAVNDALRERFPGIILSNYVGVGRFGERSQPWFDGMYGEENSMTRSWERYQR